MAAALSTRAAKAAPPATSQPLPAPVNPEESVLSEYTPEAPPNPNPPPYTLLRFNEDYRYLSDPNNRTDPFDPYKYISLSPSNPDTYLSLGGALRERYEHFTNPGFGVGTLPEHQDYLRQRLTLDADLHLSPNIRFFVQGISGLQIGDTREAAPTNQDPIDLQQAFADLKLTDPNNGKDYLIVRGGRFEMNLGAGRLVLAIAVGFGCRWFWHPPARPAGDSRRGNGRGDGERVHVDGLPADAICLDNITVNVGEYAQGERTMNQPISGLHHVTAITADPQKNIDFYCGVLGLRLVKPHRQFRRPHELPPLLW